MKKTGKKRQEKPARKKPTNPLGDYAKEARKHARTQKLRTDHSYRGDFQKALDYLDHADGQFRKAVELAECIESDRVVERLVNAVESWVEQLRVLFDAPPESCREAALKIVRERLTFPINFAGIPKKFRKNETNQTEAFDWLYRHGFQQDRCPGLPRTRGGAGIDELRIFAYNLFVELERLRAELDLRPPSGALEAEVAALPGKLAGAEWKQFFLDAPEKLFGKGWILESPQMEDYRQAVKGRQHSTHQAKGKKVRDKEMNMARDAISRFKSIANSIFRTK